jgi:hypothetical protein
MPSAVGRLSCSRRQRDARGGSLDSGFAARNRKDGLDDTPRSRYRCENVLIIRGKASMGEAYSDGERERSSYEG